MTEFEKRVYNIVKIIPRGKALTYKQIALRLSNAGLARAVGNALNKNKDPLVPCHRVIRSDGKTGGYRLGHLAKIKILEREGFRVSK